MGKYFIKVFLYHVLTYSMVFFVAILTIVCSMVMPELGFLGLGMIAVFVFVRHGPNLKGCKRKWRLEAGAEYVVKEKIAEEQSGANVEKFLAEQRLQFARTNSEDLSYCLTCATAYFANPRKKNPICRANGVPEHHVNDEPPNPNPYAWLWFQANGYEPPPFNTESHCNPYCNPAWGEQDSVNMMKARGKFYYKVHKNYIWDNDSTNAPSWYVLTHN